MDVVVGLLCGVALFLFGMLLMGSGLKNVAGNKLEMILFKLTNTPLKGVLLGTGVTAIIQSSSATSIMAVGFVNSGMMKMRQAIGIILGAILGTSVTGWVVCLSGMDGDGGSVWVKLLSTSTLTCVVAVIGIILRMFCKSPTQNHIGDILLGFAVLMTGMSMMSDVIKDGTGVSEMFAKLAPTFSNPIVGIIAGMLITCVLQSASATVGILQVLSVTGAISFEIALPIVMGIAIGAAVPVLLSALGASVAGKRTAFVYLLIDILGVVIWASVFYAANAIFGGFPFMDMEMNMVSIALMNTLFRLATVVVLMPFTKVLEKIVTFIFKDKPDDEEDSDDIDKLEERFLTHPAIALEQSNEAVCAMARKARKNLSRAMNLLYGYTEEGYRKVQAKEEVLDRYEDKLGTYLVKMTRRELTQEQSSEASKFLHTIGDFERIGDHAVNIANAAKEMNAKKLVFSPAAQKDLGVISSALSKIVILTVDSFTDNDIAMAKKVEPLEQVIDDLCDEIKIRHIKRLRDGDCTLDLGFVYNDLLTNLERIADHCSNIAVAMIELKAAEFDTHEYLNRVKTESSTDFQNTFEEFRNEFSLN